MIAIRQELDGFDEIYAMAWSGAVDTLNDIREAGKEDEFVVYLEEVFEGVEELPTETDVNDFIWFERDSIYEELGLDEDGKLIEE